MVNPFKEVNWNPGPQERRKFALSLVIGLPCVAAVLLVLGWLRGRGWNFPLTAIVGGGGLAGTAKDYMRFSRMLLNGGELEGARLLSPKTVALMTMNHLPGGRTPEESEIDLVVRADENGADSQPGIEFLLQFLMEIAVKPVNEGPGRFSERQFQAKKLRLGEKVRPALDHRHDQHDHKQRHHSLFQSKFHG